MTIAICGSLTFHNEMRDAEKALAALGHTVFVPKSLSLIESGSFRKPETVVERMAAEAKYDFIREHFRKIESAEAVLVVNPPHKGIPGYIGGNTFLEMGVAFFLGKKIYVLNPLPRMDYELELVSMHPIVLKGDITSL